MQGVSVLHRKKQKHKIILSDTHNRKPLPEKKLLPCKSKIGKLYLCANIHMNTYL
jgi:hypothetical protein